MSNADSSQSNAEPEQIHAGLLEFYSSEAASLLAQYRQINRLLGPDTHEHTHPGTHCEVLLRVLLRRNLLSWMGVDKGFICGLETPDGVRTRCTEIDILIHDQRSFRPVFRVEDFVIVQPEAVLAIIQVKKRLNTSGRNPLQLGLKNVLAAKRHLFSMLAHSPLQRRERAFQHTFPAVIGFEGQTQFKTYRKAYEYWVVATRPLGENGLGMTTTEAEMDIEKLVEQFHLFRDERAIFDRWRQLVVQHHVSGKSGHDARIVAATDRHGIKRLVSFNDQHFHRFPSITAIHPDSIDNLQPA